MVISTGHGTVINIPHKDVARLGDVSTEKLRGTRQQKKKITGKKKRRRQKVILTCLKNKDPLGRTSRRGSETRMGWPSWNQVT